MHEHPPITEISEDNFDAWISRLDQHHEAAQQEAEDRERALDHALLVEIQSLPEDQQRERMAACLKRQKSLRKAAEQLQTMRTSLDAPYRALIDRLQGAMDAGHAANFALDEVSIQESRALEQHQGIMRAERALMREEHELDRELGACIAVLVAGHRVQRPAEA